ncbi:MAG TPA: hypothetical protein VLU25_20155 [Acidobacteriota bacterium]|nr:hypothetical protein [Acidobacteriota bacterium]
MSGVSYDACMDGASLEIAFLIILVVFFVQSLALTFVLLKVSRRLSLLERNFSKWMRPLDQAASALSKTVDRILPLSRKLPPLQETIRKASDKTLETARESDERLHETVEKLRRGMRQVDRQIDDGFQSFSRYSFQVHQVILHPARRFSQVLQSASATVRAFFSRGRSVSPEFVAEEEDFI